MNLKPYFYYRHQAYPGLSKSNDDSNIPAENNPKEVTSETVVAKTEEQENKDGLSLAEPDKEEIIEPKLIFEHSRFQEVAPGIFQFKHSRPNMFQQPPASVVNRYTPEFLAGSSQVDKKPELDGFVKIGTFPGASNDGLPVYQFT